MSARRVLAAAVLVLTLGGCVKPPMESALPALDMDRSLDDGNE